MVRRELEARGVDLTHATIAGTQAESIVLLAEGHAERIVLWSHGSARPQPLATTSFDLLHVDDVYMDEAIVAARTARDAGRLVTTDIDTVADNTLELIRLATHPIMAAHVPSQLTGESDLRLALTALRAHTTAPLIATRGAQGALALAPALANDSRDEFIDTPGFTVDATDTTGAGDVFRAGFITMLLEGAALDQALRFANAAAAASCEAYGAMAGIPTRARVTEVATRS